MNIKNSLKRQSRGTEFFFVSKLSNIHIIHIKRDFKGKNRFFFLLVPLWLLVPVAESENLQSVSYLYRVNESLTASLNSASVVILTINL